MTSFMDKCDLSGNPLWQDENDKWWYLDETWNIGDGPYETEKEAKTALLKYVYYLETGQCY